MKDNRRKAEEEQRKRDAERDGLLRDLAQRVEAAFDFTSREKLDLDPRMDVLDGRGVLEFVVRSVRAIFILSQAPTGQWGIAGGRGQPAVATPAGIGGRATGRCSRTPSGGRAHCDHDWRLGSSKGTACRRRGSPQVSAVHLRRLRRHLLQPR
jgi:hypothetical protein